MSRISKLSKLTFRQTRFLATWQANNEIYIYVYFMPERTLVSFKPECGTRRRTENRNEFVFEAIAIKI